jgi:nucleoid DNA-binding protein
MTVLKKKDLLQRVVDLNRKLPQEITVGAAELILTTIADSLADGQEVCLRSFGRFIPRFYSKSKNKRIGLLFHPSPRLLGRTKTDPDPEEN